MKDDIMDFFSEFHAYGRLTKGINSTFVALMLKEDGHLFLRTLDL